MKWFNGNFQELVDDWELTENELWADYQVLGPIMSAYRVLATMQDVLPVMVGTKGCSYHVRFAVVAMGESSFDLGKRFAAVLEFPTDKIVRGELTVPSAWAARLLEALSGKIPKLIVLIPTDALIVSGANMQPVVEQVQSQTGIRTTFIEAASILGQSPQAGYSPAMSALLRPYYETPVEERSGVNLLGWHWPSRQHIHEIGECVRMLDKLGVKVKSVLSGGSSLADVENAITAQGNAVVCPAVCGDYIDDMAAHGVPLLANRSPYGFSGTREWLASIAEGLGLERSREIAALEKEFQVQFDENKDALKGKKIFISGGPGRLIGLIHLLTDYEMDIQVAALFWPHKNSQRDLAHMLTEHEASIGKMIVSPSLYEIEEIASTMKFDIWAGGYQELHTCQRHAIPFVPITVYTVPHVGFAGAVNFGDKLRMAMNGYCFTESVFNAKELPPCTQLHR